MSEVSLLQRAQAGDDDAFTALHAQLEPDIRRFVSRLVGYGQAAEDIVQDVMIAFYRHMARIDPPENLRPYVYRIARNRCYDELRWQGRYERLPLDDEAVRVRVSFEHATRHAQPLDEMTHWVMLGIEVREAIDRLPEAQRQALILYSEEGFAYAEIADIMGVSIGTVKSRLYHAKKTLRALLHPQTLQYLIQKDED